MATRILGFAVAGACFVSGTSEATTNLKPFDPVALQGVVETTAKELRLPGAMVLLHTPQGEFALGYGTTELGGTIPPRADTHFRAASNTKRMTAAVIVLPLSKIAAAHRCCARLRKTMKVLKVAVGQLILIIPSGETDKSRGTEIFVVRGAPMTHRSSRASKRTWKGTGPSLGAATAQDPSRCAIHRT